MYLIWNLDLIDIKPSAINSFGFYLLASCAYDHFFIGMIAIMLDERILQQYERWTNKYFWKNKQKLKKKSNIIYSRVYSHCILVFKKVGIIIKK